VKSQKHHSISHVSKRKVPIAPRSPQIREAAPQAAKEKLYFLSGWVNAPDDLARLEVRKGWWIGAYSVLNGELLFASRSLNALCRKLKQRPGMVWPVGVCSAAMKEELSVPAPVAQSPEQRPHDWHEELRRAGNMADDIGYLNFSDAWDAVRQLAQTNDALDQEKRIDSLWRTYPEAAEKLGLPKPPTSTLETRTAAAPRGFDGLGKKNKHDLSEYFDPAGLTERQRDCLSMKYEYELPITEIARRLNLDRKTVQEHIVAGGRRLARDSQWQKRAKRRAVHPSSQDESNL
jgi:hypothetical protein